MAENVLKLGAKMGGPVCGVFDERLDVICEAARLVSLVLLPEECSRIAEGHLGRTPWPLVAGASSLVPLQAEQHLFAIRIDEPELVSAKRPSALDHSENARSRQVVHAGEGVNSLQPP
ncbi:MAG: hypothetical protein ACYSU0_22810, partial [Planctomycetota bacterium]